mmetsp:Transcript_31251/g.50489  ORF Transcript_31251/g.50489 Transcript_31251/m.50489 type:complete len:81 (-) Transcript_31251:778-1020(-)
MPPYMMKDSLLKGSSPLSPDTCSKKRGLPSYQLRHHNLTSCSLKGHRTGEGSVLLLRKRMKWVESQKEDASRIQVKGISC